MNFFQNVYMYIINLLRNLGINKNKERNSEMNTNRKPLKIIIPVTRKNKYNGFYEDDDDEILELNSFIRR